MAGEALVLSTVEPGRLIALTDLGSGVSHRLRWPSRRNDHVMGLIEGHPEGRLVSVAFYPAHSGAEQTLDLWLLDLTTRNWQRLPDMPLRLGPSKPQATWTAACCSWPGSPTIPPAAWSLSGGPASRGLRSAACGSPNQDRPADSVS